ncbi:MFS transporter [Alcaligenes endophyticus]|uniref:MFS transporter n=1 Tax=Alcaligenes endophyticus TaxID=1929088 RepID=A0ABT8EHV2_9BURK|nr:MFS transporter [Alcaligenes endophyticus]MCX5592209.1 MFS transporter [Alcaligenes endophyticus]MDN4120856.1 MFS transporter [Alcaligenes endophyticus]
MNAPSNPDDSHIHHGRVLSVSHSILAMLGLCFVVMLVAIDQTVVGTAMPTIVAELNGFELYAWVASAYFLTSIITVPIFGRLGDFYGRRYFVIISIVLFTVSSVACGLAQSMLQLVFARALQGVAGGMLVGTAFACIPDLFPSTQVRLRWQVMLSSAFGIANAIGPSLGGVLTEQYGWRSIFYVNVPIGLLSLYFVWRYLPLIRHHQAERIRLDWQGALLLVLGLACVQLLVELVPVHGANIWMLLLGLVGGVAFALLMWWEQRCVEPLLPPAMFRNPAQVALFIMATGLGFVMFSILFYAPLALQGGLQMRPQEAGLLVTPMVVSITVGSILNSRIVTRLSRPSRMLMVGLLLLLLTCAGLVLLDSHTPTWLFVCYTAVGGVGIGFIMPNLTIFSQEIAQRSMVGIATATLQSARMVGGMLGATIVGTLITYHYGNLVVALHTSVDASASTMLTDPQLLMSPERQALFLEHVPTIGQTVLSSAREALLQAVNFGMGLVLLVILCGFFMLRKVATIQFLKRR